MAYERPKAIAPGSLEECIAIGECRPKHRGSKSTRHWCKGREGMAHEYHWVRAIPYPTFSYRIPQGQELPVREYDSRTRMTEWHSICRECGKKGSWKYTCQDCFVPIRRKRGHSWGIIVHGMNCEHRDAIFYDWGLYTMEELKKSLDWLETVSPRQYSLHARRLDAAVMELRETLARGVIVF